MPGEFCIIWGLLWDWNLKNIVMAKVGLYSTMFTKIINNGM